jgi:hypothetical protein
MSGDARDAHEVNLTGKDRILVERQGEEVEVFNHENVSTHHYVNSINGYESFEGDVYPGDYPAGEPPEAVTPRVTRLLYDEFGIDVASLGIETIDPNDPEVVVL